ncbi:hypothetical protein ACF0H5_000753 [Mactra antiquata]
MPSCDDCDVMFENVHDLQNHVKRWCPEHQPPKRELAEEDDTTANHNIPVFQDFINVFDGDIGVGLMAVIMSFNILWYIITILGWIQYYLICSFAAELPWSSCGNWWNTEQCRERTFYKTDTSINTSLSISNVSIHNYTTLNSTVSTEFTSAAEEFWIYNVLRKSEGLEDMGSMQWHLVLSNFIGWIIVGACLIKGVQSLGKVVYVTATAPYVLLTIILIRGLTLDGSINGIIWYLTPDFEKLASPQVWLEAAVQVFYSLGPAYGGVITMASHNKFHQKSSVDTMICVIADGLTAFYAGIVVFAIIGYMAEESGSTVEEVAKASGLGLAFVAYPEAVSQMPLPQLWAVLFFAMMLSTLLDSAFGVVETVTHALADLFPMLAKYPILTLVACCSFWFVISLPFSMQGGIYLFQLADWYTCSFALLAIAFMESVVIGWMYGADRFSCDIQIMTNRPVGWLLRILWCLVIPFVLIIAFFVSLAMYKTPNYGDDYVYQPYAIAIGMFLALSPFIPAVLLAFYEIYKATGTLKARIVFLLNPASTWQPIDPTAREIYRIRPYIYEKTLTKRIRTNLLGNKKTPCL